MEHSIDLWRAATPQEQKKAEKQMRSGKRSPAVYLFLAALIMFIGLTVHTLRIRLSGVEVSAGRNLFITICYALIAAVVIALTIQSVRTARKQTRQRRWLIAEGICRSRYREKSRFTVELEQKGAVTGTVHVSEEVFDRIPRGEHIRIAACCAPGEDPVGTVLF